MLKNKWAAVFCTRDRDQALRLQSLLDAEGIAFRVNRLGQERGTFGARTPAVFREEQDTQEFLVRKEDVKRAGALIRDL